MSIKSWINQIPAKRLTVVQTVDSVMVKCKDIDDLLLLAETASDFLPKDLFYVLHMPASSQRCNKGTKKHPGFTCRGVAGYSISESKKRSKTK